MLSRIRISPRLLSMNRTLSVDATVCFDGVVSKPSQCAAIRPRFDGNSGVQCRSADGIGWYV